MSMYATSMEDHLLPDTQILEQVFLFEDEEQWIVRPGICTFSAMLEY